MKNYKKQTIIITNCFAFLLIAFGASNAFAQNRPAPVKIKKAADISIRPALYFGDSVLNAQPINGKSKYVAAGKKIVLTPADSFNNENGLYSFNVMYIAYGSPMKEAVAAGEFTDRMRIGSELLNQHTVSFSDKDGGNNDTKIQYIRTQIKLPIGTHIIPLSRDDDKKVAESNENNNMHSFTVEVLAKP